MVHFARLSLTLTIGIGVFYLGSSDVSAQESKEYPPVTPPNPVIFSPLPTIPPTPAPVVPPTPIGSPSPLLSPSPQSLVNVSIPLGATGMGETAYGINPLVIQPGTTVRWINNDSAPHTVTSDNGTFDSGTLTTGQEFLFTFNEPGIYPYFCQIHGRTSMSGTVQVGGELASPSPTASPDPLASPSPTASPDPLASPSPTASPDPLTSPSPLVSPNPFPTTTQIVP